MAVPRSNTFPLQKNWQLIWRDLGIEARVVLRRAGLPEGLLSSGDASLTTEEYFRLWAAMEAETGDATFAIRLGEIVRSDSFHPLIFAALCSSTFAVAAERIGHYKRLVAPMEMRIDDSSDGFRIELAWLDRTLQPPVSLAAFELVFFVQVIRIATREAIAPLRVESLVELQPAAAYRDFFGAPVDVSTRHAITFSSEDAMRPFLTENAAMWRAFEPTLRQRLADVDEEASVAERVAAALLEALPGGESSMEEIAHKLCVSKRTLQRRLRTESTTFQAVLDATREKLARHYLSQTQLSGAEIAYLLGFEDPNSFFRAFHHWTGQTTEQARQAER